MGEGAGGARAAGERGRTTGLLIIIPHPSLPLSPPLSPLCSVTGEVQGAYLDPSSSPDQKLRLVAVRAGDAGFAFPHVELA